LPLFELTKTYDAVYKWFDYLKGNGHFITGYVIMPNHLHALIGFSNKGKSINTVISNGKRFLAYEIVERLTQNAQTQILTQLNKAVTVSDRKRGKLHQVFMPSFDCKECRSDRFVEQKLAYIHDNPCRGKWQLAVSPIYYPHSSALFYYTGKQGVYEVTNYKELHDIDLTK
jgi:hypothetical protein